MSPFELQFCIRIAIFPTASGLINDGPVRNFVLIWIVLVRVGSIRQRSASQDAPGTIQSMPASSDRVFRSHIV